MIRNLEMTKRCIGVLEFASKYRYGVTSRGAPMYLFKPYDDTLPDFIVGSTERDTTRNRIVIVDVADVAEPKSRGHLVRILGPVGDYAAEREALQLHYWPAPFASAASSAAAHASVAPTPREEIDAAHGWTVFHIDPPGCRDIDDAIAFHRETATWAITIADVAAVISADSELDHAACAQGATAYDLDGRVIVPMLPPSISEDAASLVPGQRRRGVTLFLDQGLDRWARTWITVEHSFTYESFVDSDVAATIAAPQREPHAPQREPHAWIEELMIRYNVAAAKELMRRGSGLLRVQASTEKQVLPTELQFLANVARADAIANEVAEYCPVGGSKTEHAGIGSVYCHASSPLRRYSDLVNQRVLVGDAVVLDFAALAIHLNERANVNRRWTRDLTFLTYVTPGRVHEIDVLWFSATHVWVPAWKRRIRIRHDAPPENRILIFCDPTRRNWKQRVLTAAIPKTVKEHA